jgi:hypothetical protein
MTGKRKLNESIKTRFVNDLLVSLSSNKKLNMNADIGSGLLLKDIVDNMYQYDNPLLFSGVYVQCQSTGQILIKAMKGKSESNNKVLSQTFCIKKHGIDKAFKEAVKKRAEYCGFKGALPLDDISIPTLSNIYDHVVEKKGIEWAESNSTKSVIGLI